MLSDLFERIGKEHWYLILSSEYYHDGIPTYRAQLIAYNSYAETRVSADASTPEGALVTVIARMEDALTLSRA